MSELDLIIKNGTVIGPGWVKETNIGIKNDKIVQLGATDTKGYRVIDASGLIVSPGGIDPHTHIEAYFMGAQVPEDWTKATIASAHGGTTTVLDFAGLEKSNPNDTLISIVDKKLERAKKMSVVDYSVKPMLKNSFFQSVEELKSMIHELIKKGVPGFKVFTAYRDLGIYTDDKALYEIMNVVKDEKAVLQIHAENGLIEEANRESLTKEGKKDAYYHYVAKPDFVENMAIRTSMELASVTGCPTYIVHQSTKDGFQIISKYRMNGLNVFSETCPQYLILSNEMLRNNEKGRSV